MKKIFFYWHELNTLRDKIFLWEKTPDGSFISNTTFRRFPNYLSAEYYFENVDKKYFKARRQVFIQHIEKALIQKKEPVPSEIKYLPKLFTFEYIDGIGFLKIPEFSYEILVKLIAEPIAIEVEVAQTSQPQPNLTQSDLSQSNLNSTASLTTKLSAPISTHASKEYTNFITEPPKSLNNNSQPLKSSSIQFYSANSTSNLSNPNHPLMLTTLDNNNNTTPQSSNPLPPDIEEKITAVKNEILTIFDESIKKIQSDLQSYFDASVRTILGQSINTLLTTTTTTTQNIQKRAAGDLEENQGNDSFNLKRIRNT